MASYLSTFNMVVIMYFLRQTVDFVFILWRTVIPSLTIPKLQTAPARFSVPVLKGKRIQLKPIDPNEESQLEALLQIRSDEQIVKSTGQRPLRTKEQIQALLESDQEALSKGQGVRWLVYEKNKVIGTCSFFGWNHRKKTTQVSFDILPSFWNEGYATEALKLATNYAFDIMKVDLIVAIMKSSNQRAAHVVNNAGFVGECKIMWLVDVWGLSRPTQ